MVKNPRSSAATSILAVGLVAVSFRSSTWMDAPAGRRFKRSSTWPARSPLAGLEATSEALPLPASGVPLGVLTGVPGVPAPRGQAGGAGAPGTFWCPDVEVVCPGAAGLPKAESPVPLDGSWQPVASCNRGKHNSHLRQRHCTPIAPWTNPTAWLAVEPGRTWRLKAYSLEGGRGQGNLRVSSFFGKESAVLARPNLTKWKGLEGQMSLILPSLPIFHFQ